MPKLGYQIPYFTYPGVGPAELFDAVVQQAREAESSGFDTVMVMDHFYQLPKFGEHDQYMLECYALLAALARETSTIRLSALVTGNTYRNPAILAKTVTTLDIVSGGRALLGIGAGWYQREHESFGVDFGTFTDRFEKLEEALQIIIPMLRGERPSFRGNHYTTVAATNEPPPIAHIPVMIGGGGERKTLRLAAQYADESNLLSAPKDVPRKLDALADHCDRLGRDRSEITVSWQRAACVAPTMEQAVADLNAYFRRRNIDLDVLSDDDRHALTAEFAVGDPDTVAGLIADDLKLGVDGLTLKAPANGHMEGRVALLGEAASKAFAG